MIETVTAAADLITAIPSFWEQLKVPASVVSILSGVVAGIMVMHKGVGSAAGKMIGGIGLSAIILGGVGLSASVKETVDHHTGGVLVGRYGG